jgi:hypothetical protein
MRRSVSERDQRLTIRPLKPVSFLTGFLLLTEN